MGMSALSARTSSRTLAAIAAGSPSVRTSTFICELSSCQNGVHPTDCGGSAQYRYLASLATPATWTSGPLGPSSRICCPNRIAIRPGAGGQPLIDDRDPRRGGSIAIVERAAAHDARFHQRKVTIVDNVLPRRR